MLARFAHRRMSSLVRGAFVVCGLLGLGCAAIQLGATPVELARARDQSDRGATLFASACANCHGQRGEGVGSVPDVLGPRALPEYPRDSSGSNDPSAGDPQLLQLEAQARPAGAASRDCFRNAQDVFNFISTRMPKGHGGALKPDEYWAVVNFLLAAQGATKPTGDIGPTNATSIPLPRR